MPDIKAVIEKAVLAVHRRNGGSLSSLNLDLPLLDSSLLIDSLDLAEIIVALEKDLGKSPFDAPAPPRTWRQVSEYLAAQCSS